MILSKFWQNQDAGRALTSKTLGEDTSLPPSASGGPYFSWLGAAAIHPLPFSIFT